MQGVDIFTGNKYQDISPSSNNIDIPFVSKSEFQVSSIDENYLKYLDDNSFEKEVSFDFESEIGKKIIDFFKLEKDILIEILISMGEIKICNVKEEKNN
jgi:translation initiation factor 5A